MDLKKKYIECKQRNEQQISNIQSLEAKISEVQSKIKVRQISTEELQRTANQYKRLTTLHKDFQNRAASIITEKEKKAKSSIALGRHDLTQLIAITPEKICKKIEALLLKQAEQNQAISEDELAQIKNLIEHLSDKHDIQQFTLLVEGIQSKLETIGIDPTKYETENVKSSLKYQSLLDYLGDQNQRIAELTTRKNELQLQTEKAESYLIKRIRQLYQDHELQSMLTKHMRLKAAANQVDVELSSTKAQIDRIQRKIQSIEDSTDTLNMEKTIRNLVKDFENKQEQLDCMVLANKEFRRLALEHKNQVEPIDTNDRDLIEKISTVKRCMTSDLKPKPEIEEESIHDETLDIRNAVSPKSLISTTQAISEIVNMIDSVNSLSRNSVVNLCADIRVQLENLVDKWDTSLDKQKIPRTEGLPFDYDGIDTVIQSVDALIKYIQNRELSYISEQQEKIRAKLVVVDNIGKEIETAQNTLNKRSSIKDIAKDYTIQNKTFAQWLEKINLSSKQ